MSEVINSFCSYDYELGGGDASKFRHDLVVGDQIFQFILHDWSTIRNLSTSPRFVTCADEPVMKPAVRYLPAIGDHQFDLVATVRPAVVRLPTPDAGTTVGSTEYT